jgi:G3E family GTPase
LPGQPRHGDRVGSFTFRATQPFDLVRLDAFLASMVDLYGPDMLRYKGVLDVAGRDERVIFQGVQTLMEVASDAPWQAEPRASALVFIGRDLPRALLERGLEACLVTPRIAIAPKRLLVEGAT